jgi:hypothetical protein
MVVVIKLVTVDLDRFWKSTGDTSVGDRDSAPKRHVPKVVLW